MNEYLVGLIAGLLIGGFAGALGYHWLWRDCALDCLLGWRLDRYLPLAGAGA